MQRKSAPTHVKTHKMHIKRAKDRDLKTAQVATNISSIQQCVGEH